jgi:hypothetical protein
MTLQTAIDQSCLRSFANAAGGMFWRDEQLCSGAAGRGGRLMRLLWEEGLIEDLRRLGLLPDFEPVDELGMQYDFALGLRRSLRVSYCYEWCSEMQKAGALYLVNLLRELASFQLTIDDLQPYHLLFDGPRPLYVNPACFAHLTEDNFARAITRLSDFWLHPLLLSLSGKSHLARRLLRGVNEGIKAADFPELEAFANDVKTWLEELPPAESLHKLQCVVESMAIVDAESEWSNYYSGNAPLAPEKSWSRKQHQVHRVLSEHEPRSVLDLACNIGWYSRLAAATVRDIIAVDFDETCVNRLYRRVHASGEGVLSVLMDINDPSPGFGVNGAWLTSASERLQADFVLALAVSHHLVFSGRKLTLDEVARAFSPFVKRWLLIEWIPFESEGMIYSTYDRPESATWYDLDSFVTAFAKRFANVKVLPGEPNSRRLVLCQR